MFGTMRFQWRLLPVDTDTSKTIPVEKNILRYPVLHGCHRPMKMTGAVLLFMHDPHLPTFVLVSHLALHLDQKSGNLMLMPLAGETVTDLAIPRPSMRPPKDLKFGELNSERSHRCNQHNHNHGMAIYRMPLLSQTTLALLKTSIVSQRNPKLEPLFQAY